MTSLLKTNVGEYAIILNEQNEFLMVQWGEVYNFKWHFPGGRLNGREDAQVGLERELKEELGCEIEDIKPFYTKNIDDKFKTHPRDTNRYAVFYLVKLKKASTIDLNKQELNSYKWFKKEDIKNIDYWLTFYKDILEKLFKW